ncbi:MAG TPA: hypothetical protein VNT30_09235 [Stellaceae bacterium]|nr:hypothetical protein [Stellaceae bacterium]
MSAANSDRRLLTRAEMADRLQVDLDYLYRHLHRLYADGFPRPAWGNRAGARWDPRAIDAWLDAKIARPAASSPAPAGGGEDEVDYDAILNRNAQRIVEGVL